MEEESYDMSFKLLPVTSTGMPKDTCFSPIHLDGDDNSLSREGVSMARDAF